MVKIYTSQFRYSGPDRLDITTKAKTSFSPTWDMVRNYKDNIITKQQYTNLYAKLMNQSYIDYRMDWNNILNKDRVVLVCYCNSDSFCHRFLLADYFVTLGAEYCGEIT